MSSKLFFLTFISIFIAELGDKTQLATVAFTAENARNKWIVFGGASAALVLSSFLGVFFGNMITSYVSPRVIKIAAGILFVIIGIFILVNAGRDELKPELARLIVEIEKIKMVEKCAACERFNNFLEENQTLLGEKVQPQKGGLHKPLNCEMCNTEKLKKDFKI